MTQPEKKVHIDLGTGEVVTGKFTTTMVNEGVPPPEDPREVYSSEYLEPFGKAMELKAKCDDPGFQHLYHLIRRMAKEKNKAVADVDKKEVEPIQAQLRFAHQIIEEIKDPIIRYNTAVSDIISANKNQPLLYRVPASMPHFEFNEETGRVIMR